MEALAIVIPVALCCGLAFIVMGAASLFKRKRGQILGVSPSSDKPISQAQDPASLAYRRRPTND